MNSSASGNVVVSVTVFPAQFREVILPRPTIPEMRGRRVLNAAGGSRGSGAGVGEPDSLVENPTTMTTTRADTAPMRFIRNLPTCGAERSRGGLQRGLNDET